MTMIRGKAAGVGLLLLALFCSQGHATATCAQFMCPEETKHMDNEASIECGDAGCSAAKCCESIYDGCCIDQECGEGELCVRPSVCGESLIAYGDDCGHAPDCCEGSTVCRKYSTNPALAEYYDLKCWRQVVGVEYKPAGMCKPSDNAGTEPARPTTPTLGDGCSADTDCFMGEVCNRECDALLDIGAPCEQAPHCCKWGRQCRKYSDAIPGLESKCWNTKCGLDYFPQGVCTAVPPPTCAQFVCPAETKHKAGEATIECGAEGCDADTCCESIYDGCDLTEECAAGEVCARPSTCGAGAIAFGDNCAHAPECCEGSAVCRKHSTDPEVAPLLEAKCWRRVVGVEYKPNGMCKPSDNAGTDPARPTTGPTLGDGCSKDTDCCAGEVCHRECDALLDIGVGCEQAPHCCALGRQCRKFSDAIPGLESKCWNTKCGLDYFPQGVCTRE